MNTFVSTTTSSHLAFLFSGEGHDRPLMESVVFQIVIDPLTISNNNNVEPFVRLVSSAIPGESELLISMGSVFRIDNIDDDLFDDVCYIELTMCSELNELMQYYKTQLTGDKDSDSGLLALGGFLSEMGDYARAERYYQILLDELPFEHHDIGHIYNNLGVLYAAQGQFKAAIDQYKRALDVLENYLPSDHHQLSPVLNNLGSAYRDLNLLDEALSSYERALDIQQRFGNDQPRSIQIVTLSHSDEETVML
jgi:tetratricopeptide (TPR) repeat protein